MRAVGIGTIPMDESAYKYIICPLLVQNQCPGITTIMNAAVPVRRYMALARSSFLLFPSPLVGEGLG
jgi:hypothetical protein